MGDVTNYLAPDGYRYGVMFNDGSVLDRWNGRTQRERASEAAERWAREFAPDNITVARRRHGEPWTRVNAPGDDEQLEAAAFAAFCRNMADYDFEPGNLHLAFYGDDGVRDFWIKEARAWHESLSAM